MMHPMIMSRCACASEVYGSVLSIQYQQIAELNCELAYHIAANPSILRIL